MNKNHQYIIKNLQWNGATFAFHYQGQSERDQIYKVLHAILIGTLTLGLYSF